MAKRTLTALFDRYDEASSAVSKLEAAGVPHADISIVANNADDRHSAHPAHATDAHATHHHTGEHAGDGAGTGATLGTVLGGGAGVLAGLGLLAIPGVGPVVAAGWLVSALTGAGVGAAAGGLVGSLTGAGLSEDSAHGYAEGLRRGGTLVTARVEEAMASRAQGILDEHGSIDVDERATGWRSEGWTGRSDLDATREIGSTGIGAARSTTTGIAAAAAPFPVGDPLTGSIAGTSRDTALDADEREAQARSYADVGKPTR